MAMRLKWAADAFIHMMMLISDIPIILVKFSLEKKCIRILIYNTHKYAGRLSFEMVISSFKHLYKLVERNRMA